MVFLAKKNFFFFKKCLSINFQQLQSEMSELSACIAWNTNFLKSEKAGSKKNSKW